MRLEVYAYIGFEYPFKLIITGIYYGELTLRTNFLLSLLLSISIGLKYMWEKATIQAW